MRLLHLAPPPLEVKNETDSPFSQANSRNAMLLEHFLALRGQDNLAAAASAAGAPTTAEHGHLPSTAAGEKTVEPPTQRKKKSLKFWVNKGQPKETEKSAV